MKCKNCGFENRSSVKFCEECGQALGKSAIDTDAKQRLAEVIAKPNVQPVKRSAKIICPTCGQANRPEVQFCEECGHALGKPERGGSAIKPVKTACPSCGHSNRPDVQFCEECGHALDKPGVQPVKASAKTTCPACGHANRPDVQFCEECGTALQRSGARGMAGRASQFLMKRNIKKVAIAGLAFVILTVLMFVGLNRLQYPVTKGEAKDKADTIIDTYYPELADVAPQVAEFEDKNGETLQSYSYTKTITVQQDNGNAMQFTIGAVIVVDRKTGEVEVITVR